MTETSKSPQDLRLAAAFAGDLPPARDQAFAVSVMAKVAQRRLLFDLAGAGVVAFTAALVLWAVWPILAQAIDPLAADAWRALAPVGIALAIVVSLLAMEGAGARLERAA